MQEGKKLACAQLLREAKEAHEERCEAEKRAALARRQEAKEQEEARKVLGGMAGMFGRAKSAKK